VATASWAGISRTLIRGSVGVCSFEACRSSWIQQPAAAS
jgi:hypothetical protein